MDDYPFGYCTNVHAGVNLVDTQRNLEQIATRVRQLVAPQGRLPVGLWLPEQAAMQLRAEGAVAKFRDWLEEHQLQAYTFNGFPQADFHQPVVKHAVYEPTWREPSRVQYTLQLAHILSELTATNGGSISTLPLGWPHQPWSKADLELASKNLKLVAFELERLRKQTGKDIVLAIEPEPGCVLDTAHDIVDFLERYVFDQSPASVRHHITVCHDICHSAVMFEAQTQALELYRSHGVRVGKVQVSAAVEVPWHGTLDDATSAAMLDQLRQFNEPRYLHQTTRPSSHSKSGIEMSEDLPTALTTWIDTAHSPIQWPREPWRVHFHVPIFVERFRNLLATRHDISLAAQYLQQHRHTQVDGADWFTGDYEVETYAWGVLPAELRVPDLAQGIAQELQYLQSVLTSV